jgi:hypothetical protein
MTCGERNASRSAWRTTFGCSWFASASISTESWAPSRRARFQAWARTIDWIKPSFCAPFAPLFLPPRLRQSGDFDFLRRAFAMMVSTIPQMQKMPSHPVRPSETNRVCRFTATLARSLWNKQLARPIHPPMRVKDAEERQADWVQLVELTWRPALEIARLNDLAKTADLKRATTSCDTVASAAWWWLQRCEGRYLDYVGRRELAYINARLDLDRGVHNVEVVRKLITHVC